MIYYAALLMGLVGSLHCLGMCGPIALALPVRTRSLGLKFIKYMTYNIGRILTYALLGMIIGLAGKGFAIAGLQQWVSIATGIFIIVSVFLVHDTFLLDSFSISLIIKEKIKALFKKYFQDSRISSLFILGLVNGLLPCGMVYAAILGALSTGDAFSGALFMSAFGVGTIPMMLVIGLSGSIMGFKARSVINNLTPVFACLIAVLLILRGLNLGIPYISPSLASGVIPMCH